MIFPVSHHVGSIVVLVVLVVVLDGVAHVISACVLGLGAKTERCKSICGVVLDVLFAVHEVAVPFWS
jgi:hypothetical protein